MSAAVSSPTRSRLRIVREAQGISLRELAHFTGVSHQTIHNLERGTLNVSASIKVRVARTLRVPVGELWPAESAPAMREPGSGRAQGSREDEHGQPTTG